MNLRLNEWVRQSYFVAVESVWVIALSLTFVSLMLIIEFSFHMKLILRQDSLVPAFATILVIRELGPVVSSLLLASRVGAGMAAELGLMRMTEQVDALKMIGVNVFGYLVLPRIVATVFGAFSCAVVSVGVAIVAGMAIASLKLGFTVGEYSNTMFTLARPIDFWVLTVKSTLFGLLIPIVSCYQGLNCEMGSRGIGKCATRSVVRSSVLIILVDFAVTYFFFAH